MVRKLSPMDCQDVLPTRQINFVPKESKSGKAGLVHRANDVVLGADQVISCFTIWRFICYFLNEATVMRRLKMHKSRRSVKLPRKKANQKNRPPY